MSVRRPTTEPTFWLSDRMSMVQLGNTGKLSLDLLEILPDALRTPIVHDDMDEIFMIVEGQLTVFLMGQTIEAGVGDTFTVPAGVAHGSHNTSGAIVRMIACNTPAFDPSQVDETEHAS